MRDSPPRVGGDRGGGVRKELTPVARKLRREPTEAEKYLWPVLRSKSMGVKFRRQAVIGRYIVDFVCFEKKVVIEVSIWCISMRKTCLLIGNVELKYN